MIQFLTHAYGEFRHRQTIGQHAWPHFDLLWIHSGRVRIEICGDEVELLGGSGVLIYPDTFFVGWAGFVGRAGYRDDQQESKANEKGTTRASVQHFLIEDQSDPSLLPEPLQRLYGQVDRYEAYSFADTLFSEEVDRAIRWTQAPQTERLGAMRVAQLTLILGQLAEHRQPAGRRSASTTRISQVASWLEKQFDRPIALEEMATKAELSASHFRMEFRKQIGASPGEFHQRVRMREAARLLCESADPIKSIAARVGYRDLPNFYRAFKNYSGVTPAIYQKQNTFRG